MVSSTSGSTELWQALVGTALMGTDRQKPNPPQAKDQEDALTTVVGQLDWQQSEQALLGAAGAIALHHQVGQLPNQLNQAQDLPALEICEADEMPRCHDLTARHLNQILESQTELLPELLALMAAAGQRVPEMLLPKLLRHGQKRVAVRPAILAVLGERGRWLAAQNSAWRYGQGKTMADFTTEMPELKALWPDEGAQSRALKLAAWREVDASAAREALEAIWSGELAKERHALLGALETNLSLADEAFVEKALGDKGQTVRRLAVHLLAKLPGSVFCDRMTQRATASVQIETSSSGIDIQVTLPEAYGEGWKRDGIELKAPPGKGQRAWWLHQLIAGTPLEAWQVEPEAIAQAVKNHKWQDTLILGWGLAAQHQRNVDWASALLKHFGLRQFRDIQFIDLLSLLSAETQECFWRDALVAMTPKGKGKRPDEKELQTLLEQITQTKLPLSVEFSKLLIQQIKLHLQSKAKKRYHLVYTTHSLAYTLHPESVAEFSELLEIMPENLQRAYDQNAFSNAVQTIFSSLSFRREMHQAFDASG